MPWMEPSPSAGMINLGFESVVIGEAATRCHSASFWEPLNWIRATDRELFGIIKGIDSMEGKASWKGPMSFNP